MRVYGFSRGRHGRLMCPWPRVKADMRWQMKWRHLKLNHPDPPTGSEGRIELECMILLPATRHQKCPIIEHRSPRRWSSKEQRPSGSFPAMSESHSLSSTPGHLWRLSSSTLNDSHSLYSNVVTWHLFPGLLPHSSFRAPTPCHLHPLFPHSTFLPCSVYHHQLRPPPPTECWPTTLLTPTVRGNLAAQLLLDAD